MACKPKGVSGAVIGGTGSTFVGGFDAGTPSAIGHVQGLLPSAKNLKLALPKKDLTPGTSAIATSKRIYMIDEKSFGPTAKERKEKDFGGMTLEDLFRFTSGRHWTTDKDSRLIYQKTFENKDYTILTLDLLNTGEKLQDFARGSETFLGAKQWVVVLAGLRWTQFTLTALVTNPPFDLKGWTTYLKSGSAGAYY